MYHCGILAATLLALALGEDGVLPTTTTPPTTPTTEASQKPPLLMSDMCLFGDYPSQSCRFRCSLKNMEAYCDSDEKCLCRPAIDEDDDVIQDDIGQSPHDQGQLDFPPYNAMHMQSGIPENQLDFAPYNAMHMQSGFPENKLDFAPHNAMHMQSGLPENHLSTGAEHEKNEKQDLSQHIMFYFFDLSKLLGYNTTDSTHNTTAAPGIAVGRPVAVKSTQWAAQHIIALLIILMLAILIMIELLACYKKRSSQKSMESIFKTVPMPNKS